MEEREGRAIARLLHEAKLPRMKTRSSVSAAQRRTLAEGDYVAKAEPILLVGEAGTGKTHLATGLWSLRAVSGGGCGSPPRPR